MRVVIDINTDGAAWQDHPFGEWLRVMGRCAQDDILEGGHPATVLDTNGNHLATITITGDDE